MPAEQSHNYFASLILSEQTSIKSFKYLYNNYSGTVVIIYNKYITKYIYYYIYNNKI